MADRRRIITRASAAARPAVQLDLESSDTYVAIRDTFTLQQGDRGQQLAEAPSRYGGATVVGERFTNGSVSWQMLVSGTTADVVAQRVEALLTQVEAIVASTGDAWLEWRPDGMTYSSFFRLAGPATWTPTYRWAQFSGAQSMIVDLSFPVRPLVEWDPMSIIDDFSVDSTGDYTFDTGSGTLAVSSGQLAPSSIVSKRLYHSARGYTYTDAEVTLKFTTGSSVATHEKFIMLRRLDASNYLMGGFTSGGNTFGIYTVTAGTPSLKASSVVALSTATTYWVRFRCKANVLTVEYFTAEPIVGNAATGTVTHTLAGADATAFGAGIAGNVGLRLLPGDTNERYDNFRVEPFANLTVNTAQAPADEIPGTAPALLDLEVEASESAPFGLFAWTDGTLTGDPPFGIFNASAKDASSGGWSVSGTELLDAGADGIYSAEFDLDLGQITPDDFGDTCDLEIWARFKLAPTVTDMRAWAHISNSFYFSVFTEFGDRAHNAPGRLLIPPGSTGYVWTRLGVVTVDVVNAHPDARLVIETQETSSSGAFGLSQVMVVPAHRRALNPTGVANDSSYPNFISVSSDSVTKRVTHDLAGYLKTETQQQFWRHHGIGGAVLHAQPGPVNFLMMLSVSIPDDPNGDPDVGVSAGAATYRVQVTPRSYLLRGE